MIIANEHCYDLMDSMKLSFISSCFKSFKLLDRLFAPILEIFHFDLFLGKKVDLQVLLLINTPRIKDCFLAFAMTSNTYLFQT